VTEPRTHSFGQDASPSFIDRAGRYLSTRRLARLLGPTEEKRCADIGCGFDAALGRALFADARQTLLVDVAVDPSLGSDRTRILEGHLPDVLTSEPDGSIDSIICNNVIEHLWDPLTTLQHFHRLLTPGGVCVVNVPSWWGKVALEFAAFRLKVAPASEMNDHKTYYDPRELWPLLVQAGFSPQNIKIRRHKFRLNTVASCGR
jgi:SAM-dependent methyltransferase